MMLKKKKNMMMMMMMVVVMTSEPCQVSPGQPAMKIWRVGLALSVCLQI